MFVAESTDARERRRRRRTDALQMHSALLTASCFVLHSLPETRERRARDEDRNIRVYRGGTRRVFARARAGMGRIGLRTRGLRREAKLYTRILALHRCVDCKAATLWFADMLETAVVESMAAARISALRRSKLASSPESATAVLIELRDSGLQSVELGRDGVN